MPEQPERARERIAEHGRTDVADVHRFGDVRRTEINHNRTGRGDFLEEKMRAARSRLQRFDHGGCLEPKVDKAGTSNLDLIAKIVDLQFAEDVGGELARVEL